MLPAGDSWLSVKLFWNRGGTMEYKIIDVSRYQGRIDWRRVKADGVDGAMLKTVSTNSSFGGIYIDQTFERNYSECKRLGIPVGVYYYTYALDKGYADRELAKLKEALNGKTFELPIAIDVEDNSLSALSPDSLSDLVAYAGKVIESWGAYVSVYTYTNFKNTRLNMAKLSSYDLWQADYRGVEPQGVGMWQYTSQASVNGISGNVDMSYAYRDYPTIIKNAKLNIFTDKPIEAPIEESDNWLLKVVKAIVKFLKGI